MGDFLESQTQYLDYRQNEYQQSRSGDWICVRCSNLNFSFRKKCNRCKIQTRQQNDKYIYDYYHYCQQVYENIDDRGYQTNHSCEAFKERKALKPMDMNIIDKVSGLKQFEEEKVQIRLPSVSPIVNRYNKDKNTPKTEISQGFSSQEQGNSQKQFLNQYCWKNILIDQEVENQLSSKDGNDYWDTEIERIMKNIII